MTNDGYTLIVGIERGMVFWGEVRKNEHRDMEQYHGIDDPCPWLILSADAVHRRLALVIAAPLTSKLSKEEGIFRSYRIRVPGSLVRRYRLRPGERPLGNHDSLVLTEQIRAMAHDRLLGDPVARLDDQMMDAVEAGAKFALDFA